MLRRRYAWIGVLALLATSPAWANYSWGAFTLFRPGVQLGIVLLTLVSETVVFAWLAAVPWLTSAIAVAGANLLSGLMGMVFLEPNLVRPQLLIAAVPISCLLEAIVLVPTAEAHRKRAYGLWPPPHAPASHPWFAVLVANVVSFALALGYVAVLFHGHQMPLVVHGREPHMRSHAHVIATIAQRDDRGLRLAMADGKGPVYIFRDCARTEAVTVDIAPAWAPWAQLRTVRRYEVGEVPDVLDPPESGGRPMIWTGAPWVNGRRAVIFTDGSFRIMSEREFRKLGAVARPLPGWLVAAMRMPATLSPRAGTPPPSPHVPAAGSSPSRAAPGAFPRSPGSAPPPL